MDSHTHGDSKDNYDYGAFNELFFSSNGTHYPSDEEETVIPRRHARESKGGLKDRINGGESRVTTQHGVSSSSSRDNNYGGASNCVKDSNMNAFSSGLGTNADNDDDLDDDDDDDDDDDGGDEDGSSNARRKRARLAASGVQRSMTEDQKIERRERNREHAKRSRVRKKFLLESLQQSVTALQEENDKLKVAIRTQLPAEADSLLASCASGSTTVIADDAEQATKTLDDPDYSLVKALQTAQQNFVITDPLLPDNPIVYASEGFLRLTGYTLDQVLGRNCRFLQGPGTDPKAVERIRKGIEKGDDTTVVLLNYRSDGSHFWNQFFVAPLRDGQGNIVNYMGVQCKVSEEYAQAFVSSDGGALDI